MKDAIAHLLSLPSELLIQEILARLSFRTLITCLRTCKQLHVLITSSPFLLYIMELDIAGLIDNPRCPYSLYPIPVRLEMLRERERRWLHLSHASRTQVCVPRGISGHYDLGGGSCIFGKLEGDFAQGTYSLSLPPSSHSCEAQGNLGAAAEWSQFDLGEHIIDYGLALEDHDLAAFITCVPQANGENPIKFRIHLIQFSTHARHPLAQHPILELPISEIGAGELLAEAKISGNNLAAAIRYQRLTVPSMFETQYGLSVWNWKTGQGLYLEVGSQDVTFLAENLIANPNIRGRTLDVYRIPDWEECRTANSSLEPGLLERIYRLSFPELNPSSFIWGIRIRCDPSPLALFRSSLSPRLLPHTRPFSANPSAAIIQIHLDMASYMTGAENSITIIVRRQSLLKYAQKVQRSPSPSPSSGGNAKRVEPPPVPWTEWGPDGTRCLPIDFSRNPFINECYGERCVYIRAEPGSDPYGPPPRWLELFDFNQDRVSQFRARARAYPSTQSSSQSSHSTTYIGDPSNSEDVADSTSISFDDDDDDLIITHVELLDADQPNFFPAHTGIFKDDLYSRLPCLRTTYLAPEIPLEEEDDTDHSINRRDRRRDRFVRWIGKNIKRRKRVSPPSPTTQRQEDSERDGDENSHPGQPRYRTWDWDGVMIDDQRVIGTRVRPLF